MNILRSTWLFLACCLTLAATGRAAPELTVTAAQAFDQGDFATAATNYEHMVKDGVVNGHLYYNLGMTYYRLGRTGDAVAAFLAARRYLPRDPDTAANLRFALTGIHDKLEPEVPRDWLERVGFWINHFTVKELAWAAALVTAVWGVVMTGILLVPTLNKWRWSVAPTVLLPALLVASTIVKSYEGQTWGAVDQTHAKVYSGPGTLNAVVFELQEGAPVLVTETAAGGFYRIQLSDGKKGWIASSDIKVLGPT